MTHELPEEECTRCGVRQDHLAPCMDCVREELSTKLAEAGAMVEAVNPEPDDHPNGFLCRRHGVDDCFCSGPPDYTIALASRPGSPEWFAEERARRDATSEMDGPDDIEFDDCTSGDMETWLNCLCTTDTGCQPDAPGEPLARDATCTGPCKANPMDCPGPDADGTCLAPDGPRGNYPTGEQIREAIGGDEVPALLSKGRVGCRWCSWHSEYLNEADGYRALRDHWASGICDAEDVKLADLTHEELDVATMDPASEPRLLGTGYRTTTEKRDSVVQPTGAGADSGTVGDIHWVGPFERLAVRCEAVARRLVRAIARQPRRRS